MHITKAFILPLFAAALIGHACAQTMDNATLARSRAKFEKRDAELNAVYKTVIASLDKIAATELRRDEKKCLEYRDTMSENAPRFNTGVEPANPKSTVDLGLHGVFYH